MKKQTKINFVALLTLIFITGFLTVVVGMIGVIKYVLN